ncbi:unnamed protein product [Cuscuta campestris]|uniref:Homeobox domain-containing protein n=1 Tax=Cuscuta campestris TaxID=132261 RepID=A0A484NNB3_9ASTE|nr:unnamed protein product [Cuscuta campestris]
MNEFQGVVNQLVGMKMKLEDELQALLLLSSLPDSWDTLVVSLSNSAPNGKMTMEMVKASLLNEEARRKESGYPIQAEANVIPESSRGRSKSRNPHYRDKSRGRSKSRKRDFICHYCQKPGHIERFCRKKKRDMSRERKDKNENSEHKPEEKNTTALASSDDDLFVIGDHGLLNVACDDCTWVIDSGASYHITSHMEYFSSYTSGDFGHVRMGNDGSSKIIGMGDVCLETSTGCRLVLRDVRHVPDIRLSLISAGLLDDEGYANKFCDGRWKLSRGSLIMARGKKQNSLYVMQARGYKEKIGDIREEILRKRRAGKLPGDTTSVLKAWWQSHSKWPYPTEEDKARLVAETGLQLKQINNWFINQRKRNWHNNSFSSTSSQKSKRKSAGDKLSGEHFM